MSDVSGIPYMGPMGQGNFFAPQFSYNPQINPTAGYAGPAAYSQGVFDNTIRNLEYDQRLFQHYYEKSLMGVANMPPPSAPGTFTDYNAGGAWPEGGRGGPPSPYRTTPNVWETGASPFLGGGGSSGMGGSIFGGGLGGGSMPSIDWGKVGAAAGGLTNPDPYPGMSMPGGLGKPLGSPSGAQPFDWSHLWGGGGGARNDPAPGMTMPGGLGSPMSTAAPSAPSYGQLGGDRAYEPPASTMPSSKALLGYEPDATLTQGAKPPEQPAFDFTNGTAGWGNAPTATPSSKALLGYEPQDFPVQATKTEPDRGLDPNYWTEMLGGRSPATSYDTFQGGGGKSQGPESALTPGGGLTAAELGTQARDKLAKLMSGAEAEKAEIPAPAATVVASDERVPLPRERPAEAPADPYEALAGAIPVPRERPAGADVAARVPGDVDTSMSGRQAALKTLEKELSALGLVMTSSYRDPSHPLSQANPRSAHTQALAFDTRAKTPEQADAAMGQIRELFGARGMVEGRDYKILDEVRNPSGHATAPHVHTALTPRGMEQYQRDAYGTYQPVTPPRPPADIPLSEGVPTPRERPAEAPTAEPSASRSPATSYGSFQQPSATTAATDTYPGTAAPRPPANIPAATAPKHSGLELARANIDTPIEKIAMERGGQKAVDQISSMAMGMTPRQLQQTYGGLFMSRAEPMFQSLGITRQDFEKAASMPPTRQDLKMRFGDFGTPVGGPVGGVSSTSADPLFGDWSPYPGFRQSGNVEDRRDAQQLSRDAFEALEARGSGHIPAPDTAGATPLGIALGMGDLPAPEPGGLPQSSRAQLAQLVGTPDSSFEDLWGDRAQLARSMADFQSPTTDYASFQQPASPKPQVSFEPDFMDVIQEVESSGNPNKVKGSYKGLYQLDQPEFTKYGGTGSIFDPEENTKAAGAKMVAESQRVQDRLGRELTPPEHYMVHQQGVAGALAHLANPDQLAWKNFKSASGWNDADAKEAIWGNMTPEMQRQFGSVDKITSRDFLRLWDDRYYGILNR